MSHGLTSSFKLHYLDLKHFSINVHFFLFILICRKPDLYKIKQSNSEYSYLLESNTSRQVELC